MITKGLRYVIGIQKLIKLLPKGRQNMIYGSWVLTSFVICNILLIVMTAIGYYFQAKNDKDNR